MKFKPIENPTLVGCLTCGSVPKTILDKDQVFSTHFFDGASTLIVYFGNCRLAHYFTDEIDCTIRDIEKKYAKVINKADAVLIRFESALHSEKYELNKEDNNWYLIEQGSGWA